MNKRKELLILASACLVAGMVLGAPGSALSWWYSNPGVSCATDPTNTNSVSEGWVTSANNSVINMACPISENADHPHTSMTSVVVRGCDWSTTGPIGTVAVLRDPLSLSFTFLGSTASAAASTGCFAYTVPLPAGWNGGTYAMWAPSIRISLPGTTGLEARSTMNQYDVNW